MLLKAYGFTGDLPDNQDALARITAVHKERYEIMTNAGSAYARLKTSEYYRGTELFPTVGDFVLIQPNPDGDSQIIQTLPRRTYFARRDPTPGRGEQAVAANFDYVFILQSMNMDFNPKRLERYLTLAWQSGASPVVLLTKADLTDCADVYIAEAERVAAGAPVHAVSAAADIGLEALNAYLLPEKTAVFLGSSGVGKSSLVNALAGSSLMAVNTIREDDSKGRHTTTYRQLIMLPCGAMIIDTPGMRELGMWDVSSGLGEAFSDVEAFASQCRFRDCSHQQEPGCAVRAAMENGMLDPARWESYLRLQTEAEYTEDKGAFLRQKQQWHKDLRKRQKRAKKEIW